MFEIKELYNIKLYTWCFHLSIQFESNSLTTGITSTDAYTPNRGSIPPLSQEIEPQSGKLNRILISTQLIPVKGILHRNRTGLASLFLPSKQNHFFQVQFDLAL